MHLASGLLAAGEMERARLVLEGIPTLPPGKNLHSNELEAMRLNILAGYLISTGQLETAAQALEQLDIAIGCLHKKRVGLYHATHTEDALRYVVQHGNKLCVVQWARQQLGQPPGEADVLA